MEDHVLVELHANNGYVAEVIGLPNWQAIDKTEEAISKARETLTERLWKRLCADVWRKSEPPKPRPTKFISSKCLG